MGIAPGEPAPLVDTAASTKPAASIHAAAALVAWLYGNRSVVADRTAAMRTLAEKAMALAERIGSR